MCFSGKFTVSIDFLNKYTVLSPKDHKAKAYGLLG